MSQLAKLVNLALVSLKLLHVQTYYSHYNPGQPRYSGVKDPLKPLVLALKDMASSFVLRANYLLYNCL